MKQWLGDFEKAVKNKIPVKFDTDPDAYNYRVDHMGVERERRGFAQISVCVDGSFGKSFEVFQDALKRAGKYLIEMYNEQPYKLYGIKRDGSFAYLARASQVVYVKRNFEIRFNELYNKKWTGLDPFKPKKASLCLLITDDPGFSLPEETISLLRRKYGKVIKLDFSGDEVVKPLK